MEALQDKRVRLQPECKKRLQDRIDMWSYAAKVHGRRRFSRQHTSHRVLKYLCLELLFSLFRLELALALEI